MARPARVPGQIAVHEKSGRHVAPVRRCRRLSEIWNWSAILAGFRSSASSVRRLVELSGNFRSISQSDDSKHVEFTMELQS